MKKRTLIAALAVVALGAGGAAIAGAAGGKDDGDGHDTVSYTHLTLPTNREV